MDAFALSTWLYAGSLLISGGAGLLALHVKRIAVARTEAHVLEGRLARVEACIVNAPSAREMHELSLGIARLEGELKALCARSAGIESGMNRIEKYVDRQEEHLLARGGGTK